MILSYKYGFENISYKALYTFQTLRLFILFRIVDPFLHFLFYATLASALVGSDYLTYVVIGNIAYYTCHTMLFNFLSMFRLERRFGTLELNIASPTSTLFIILRKAVVPLLDGLLVFIIGLFIGSIIFGLHFPLERFGEMILLFVVMLLSILCFGLVFASIGLLFENVNLFLNIVLATFQIFCGVNFSVTLLPEQLEMIARILPLTHSIEALRSIYGTESYSVMPLLVTELIIASCYLLAGILLVFVMEKAARRNGALFKNT